jgi:putative ABC transport system permease protein
MSAHSLLGISVASVWARKRRLMGTAVAVVLGVAFLTGTLVLGDTLSANFDRLFAEVSAGTDVVVRNDTAIDTEEGPDDARGPVDESLVDTVRGVDGVRSAEGQVVGYGALIGEDGDAIGGNGPPRLAGSWITTPDLNPYKLAEGRAPEGPDEVVVNRGAADDGGLALGDTTTVQVPQPVEVTIVGIATFGDTDGLGETTWTAFDLVSAQELLTGQPDQVNSIVVAADDGVSSDELRQRIDAALPDGVEAITGAQLADERTEGIAQTFLSGLRMGLVTFAGIALVVATLSIANTFSVTVAQRTRELALLRAVGASKRQVRTSVSIEALALGVVASAVGLVAGLGIAGGLKGLFDAFGFALPAGGLTIKTTSLVIGLVAGVIATFVAAQSAARRASRLAPVAALRDTSAEARDISTRRRVTGLVVLSLGAVATVLGALAGSVLLSGVAALGVLVGALLLAPIALGPVAAVLGGGLRRLRGVNGMMATQNARRNPRRSSATAMALVVGVAVVTLFTVFVTSFQATLTDQMTEDFGADLAVTTPSFGGGRLAPTAVDEIADLDEVDVAAGLGGGPVSIDGDTTNVTASDPVKVAEAAQLDVLDGSIGSLGDQGIAVGESRAEDDGLSVGSTVDMTFIDGSTEPVTVEAIYDDNSMVGGLLVPESLWAAHTEQPTLSSILMTLPSGVSEADARRAIEPIAERLGGEVQDAEEFASTTAEAFDLLLGVVYALLALAVIIALLGIANTLSLAVHERRRELGLLRAVGQTRRQVRSTMRLESVIVSVFGTTLGLVLGAFLGWSLFSTVADGLSTDTRFAFPVVQLVVITVLGALAGVIAAQRPARRAARLPVLEAIASE